MKKYNNLVCHIVLQFIYIGTKYLTKYSHKEQFKKKGKLVQKQVTLRLGIFSI